MDDAGGSSLREVSLCLDLNKPGGYRISEAGLDRVALLDFPCLNLQLSASAYPRSPSHRAFAAPRRANPSVALPWKLLLEAFCTSDF